MLEFVLVLCWAWKKFLARNVYI